MTAENKTTGAARDGETATALTADGATTDDLWAALHQARNAQQQRTLARVEDGLFRYYQPMARSMAAFHIPNHPNPEELEKAAEIGLAQSILGWRNRWPNGFEEHAQSVIAGQLRRYDAVERRRIRHGLAWVPRPARGRPDPDLPIAP